RDGPTTRGEATVVRRRCKASGSTRVPRGSHPARTGGIHSSLSWEGVRMQIRLTPDLDAQTRSVRAKLTVDEFLARFPEVPHDLRDEPVLAENVAAFGPLLRLAQKPSPCVGSGGDMKHVFYTKLVNDMAIYGIGLAKRDRTLTRLRATV